MVIKKFMDRFTPKFSDEFSESKDSEEFIEIEPVSNNLQTQLTVRYYTLTDFEDVKNILTDLREGYTVSFIKIKPLKEKNLNELRRAIDKIKKTCFALEGEVVGFDEDWVVAVPSYVKVHRGA